MITIPSNSLHTYTDMINSATAKQTGSKVDVKRLMEILQTTDDTELQAKIFSFLAIYLVEDDSDKDLIIMSDSLYDKIQNVLSKGQPMKTGQILNFVSALLYLDEAAPSRARSLGLRARHRLRTSGCLLIMCNLFANCMLHQETWSALCLCLAECCRDCHENQSYCSHLVPVCVHKCIQNNMDAVITLKSLIHNNDCNTKLFIECNGLAIFSGREALQHTRTMQLLNIVVQHIPTEKLLLLQDTVIANLQYYKEMYGTQTKIGEWATVILYHINSRMKNIKGFNIEGNSIQMGVAKNTEATSAVGFPKPDDTVKFLQNVVKEIYQNNKNKNNQKRANDTLEVDESKNNIRKYNYRKSVSIVRDLSTMGFDRAKKGGQNSKCVNNNELITNPDLLNPNKVFNDETAVLLQNIIREVHQNKSDFNHRRASNSVMKKPDKHSESVRHMQQKYSNEMEITANTFNETSYSFLLKQHFQESSTKFLKSNKSYYSHATGETIAEKKYDSHGNLTNRDLKTSKARNDYLQRQDSLGNTTVYNDDDDDDDNPSLDFQPIFVSTPKRPNKNGARPFSDTGKHKTFSKISKRRRTFNRNNQSKKGKDLKRRSMSSRLFDAINDSCITVVNTFKNIFKPKQNFADEKDRESIMSATKDDLESTSSYSFTKYMRKREAILSNETTCRISSENKLTKLCKTCDDTITLKCKVTNNAHLKETLTKLKVGINLYGCDFKRISRVIWPQDHYMTPEVLYNLYRKLIIKIKYC